MLTQGYTLAKTLWILKGLFNLQDPSHFPQSHTRSSVVAGSDWILDISCRVLGASTLTFTPSLEAWLTSLDSFCLPSECLMWLLSESPWPPGI